MLWAQRQWRYVFSFITLLRITTYILFQPLYRDVTKCLHNDISCRSKLFNIILTGNQKARGYFSIPLYCGDMSWYNVFLFNNCIKNIPNDPDNLVSVLWSPVSTITQIYPYIFHIPNVLMDIKNVLEKEKNHLRTDTICKQIHKRASI